MSSGSNLEPGNDASPRNFVATHWSVVLSAKQGTPEEVDAARTRLCNVYWWPLFFFARRQGYGLHDAQDLTQEFFTRLLAGDFLQAVDPSKGKFRSLLLASLKNLMAKEWHKANAQKRGGKVTFVPIDAEIAEQQYLQVPASNLSPEQLFDQQWAIALFGEVLNCLREEFVAKGQQARFEAIKIFLTGEKRAASYYELATQLGTTQKALKTAVMRMRKRFRKLLRVEIAKTVGDPAAVTEELLALQRALSLQS